MEKQNSLATHYLSKADQLLKEQNFLEAIEIYKLAIQSNPNFSWAYYFLGKAYLKTNQYQEATDVYQQAIKLNPQSQLFNSSLDEVLTLINKDSNTIHTNDNWVLTLDKYEKKVYSQSGEDGILERIFEKIGVTNKFVVEFGEPVGGKNSNSANLLINQGWTALLFDINPRHEQVHKAIITAENINPLFEKHLVPKCFDLLSIDIDGNDFWVWKSLDENRFQPRVVMIEFNCNFPFHISKTIAYNPDHKFDKTKYYGASLAALRKLGEFKKYSLVYHTGCLNAFFVLTELLPPDSRYLPLEEIFHPPDIESFGKKWGFGNPSWFNSPNPEQDSRDLNWVEI